MIQQAMDDMSVRVCLSVVPGLDYVGYVVGQGASLGGDWTALAVHGLGLIKRDKIRLVTFRPGWSVTFSRALARLQAGLHVLLSARWASYSPLHCSQIAISLLTYYITRYWRVCPIRAIWQPFGIVQNQRCPARNRPLGLV